MKATLPAGRIPIYMQQSSAAGAVLFAGVFFGVVALSVIFGKVPALILWGYLAISLLTFLVYAFDKTAARDGAWRTKESTLHLLSLAGGWPGALIAQQKLRHKSRKERFRIVYWMTVMMNVIAFAWLFTSTGASTLQSWIGWASW